MAAPTIQDLFGNTATVATSETTVSATTGNPALIIRFADLSSTGWGTVAGASSAEKWFTALLLMARQFSANAPDDVANINVQPPFLGLTTRNSTTKREYAYTVQVYEADTGSASPDPDNV